MLLFAVSFRFVLPIVVVHVVAVLGESVSGQQDNSSKRNEPKYLNVIINSPVQFGKNVTLTAPSNQSVDVSRRWARCDWSKCHQLPEELLYNGASFTDDKSKFTEQILAKGFSLTIYNLTEADVNKTYKLFLGAGIIYAVNITAKDAPKRSSIVTRTSLGTYMVVTILGCILALALVIIVIYRYRKTRKNQKKLIHGKSDDEEMVPVVTSPIDSKSVIGHPT